MFELVIFVMQWLGMFLTLVALLKGATKVVKLARAVKAVHLPGREPGEKS